MEDYISEIALGEELVIPIVSETLGVQKRVITTGGARVIKTVTQHEETIDETLLREEVSVERVPINQVIEEPRGTRQEGDTLIIPLMEEVLFVEKRLMLKEELRITRTQTQTHQPQQVALRTEEAVIEKIEPQNFN